tara:strand:- start:346 stop:807 length:462 start_codon:yes stop_codon:yes gene_type:complete
MNKKQFMKIITEVVRKEVKKEVKKIFIKEETREKTSNQLIDIIPEIVEPHEEIHFTKNKSLNDVLNETIGLSKKPSQSDEYPTLGGGAFDSSKMSEMLGYGKSDDLKRDMVAVDSIQKAGKSVDQVPDYVKNALTKDYSGLMKALDKKKGGPL